MVLMRTLPDNSYHFITHWFAPGATLEEVYAIISDAEALPLWWPSVYLGVELVNPGDPLTKIGRSYDLLTRGWLPYTLKWRLTVRELNPPFGSTIGASGDFVGRGIWRFTPRDDGIAISFDWKLLAEKPLLRLFSPLFKPAFAANHHWAMARGQTSLLQELERRRALSETERAAIPAPPGPTTWQPYVTLGISALFLAAVTGLALRFRRAASTDD